jgi:type IV pilus assembly protein PilA
MRVRATVRIISRELEVVTVKNQRGFTLVELVVVLATIGVLVAIAIPLYSNMQARGRVAKAQADLRGMLGTIVAFSAHCGDVPGTVTWTSAAPLPATPGTTTCMAALADTLATLAQTVVDPSGATIGPLYANFPVPPAGWQYSYTRTGVATFKLAATNPSDAPPPGVVFP